ncbi:MAG: hypothetical protein Q4F57_06615 [Weeksellaceae bacterium]|nr:hypothetical protein [Weeksellaceae bacterium]
MKTKNQFLFLLCSILLGSGTFVHAQNWVNWGTGKGNLPAQSGSGATSTQNGASTITGTVNLGGATGTVTATITALVNTNTGWTYLRQSGFTNVLFSSDRVPGIYTSEPNVNATISNALGVPAGTANDPLWFASYKVRSNPSTPPNIFEISFDKNVIINQLNIADLDASGTHNESYTISGYDFISQSNNLNTFFNPTPTVTSNSVTFPASTNNSSLAVGAEYIRLQGSNTLPAGSKLTITFHGVQPSSNVNTSQSSNNNIFNAFALQISAGCAAGTANPTLSATSATFCGGNTYNLGNITSSNLPANTTLTWHSATPASNANRITNLNVGSAGTYYAAFFDAVGNCYSPSTAFTLSSNTVSNPGTISASQNSVCTGTAPTAINSTAAATGTGTITYRWERSTTNATSGFATIAGATSATYTPTALSQTTWYRRVAISTLNGVSCESISNVVNIAVTPNNTVSPGASAAYPLRWCAVASDTVTLHTTTGATGIGTATGLPAGLSVSWSNNTITLTGNTTAMGTYTYSIPLTGGCGNIVATGTIEVEDCCDAGDVAPVVVGN